MAVPQSCSTLLVAVPLPSIWMLSWPWTNTVAYDVSGAASRPARVQASWWQYGRDAGACLQTTLASIVRNVP